MKRIVIGTTLITALASTGLAGCSVETNDEQPASQVSQAYVAEIPATSAVGGAVVWRFGLESDGGRAWALDADGQIVAQFRLTRSEQRVTIVDLLTDERIEIDSDGNVLDSTLHEGSLMPHALGAVSSDVDAYERSNPERPMGCGWDFTKMFGWCAGTAGVCNHVLGWACVATGAGCVNAAGDFYYNCLSS